MRNISFIWKRWKVSRPNGAKGSLGSVTIYPVVTMKALVGGQLGFLVVVP